MTYIRAMSLLFILIVVFIIGEWLLGVYLDHLNGKLWTAELPEELQDVYEPEKYAKAQRYEQERNRLGTWSSTVTLIATLLFLFLGGFPWLNGLVTQWFDAPVLQALAFFGLLSLPGLLLSLPLSWYSVFHIEERYGFNKTKPARFVMDKIKGLLLTVAIGGGILSLIVWFYHTAGSLFWLYAWIAMTVISLFFATFYTTLLAPIFNKLSPLEAGSLRSKIEAFAAKIHFPLDKVMVIDGSKRSTKANAYFSGLGNTKNIVLFDTLIEQQDEEEIVAILAHEVGHYKHKHIYQGMLINTLHTGLFFYLIGLFVGSEALSQALGVAEPNFHVGILAFGMLFRPISTVTGLMMNAFSRKNEYEADNYAKTYYRPEPLITSLKKLSAHHLSNLQPHPLYVLFYYSHPPLLARIRNLKGDR